LVSLAAGPVTILLMGLWDEAAQLHGPPAQQIRKLIPSPVHAADPGSR
jgi:hypothetical protein